MWKWLASWYAKLLIAKTRWQLERRLASSGGYVEVKACGGRVTLHSYQPAQPTTATVTRAKVDGSEQVTRAVTTSFSRWEGRAHFPCWDCELELAFTTAGARPSKEDLSHLESLINDSPFIKPEVERQVFRYYQEQIVPHGPTEEDGTPLPAISSPDDLERVVYVPPSVAFSLDELDRWDFTFQFSTKWNDYFVAVDVKDWQVVNVT